jgi:hypothetical protein
MRSCGCLPAYWSTILSPIFSTWEMTTCWFFDVIRFLACFTIRRKKCYYCLCFCCLDFPIIWKSTWLKHFWLAPFLYFLRLLALFVILEIVWKYYLHTKPNPVGCFFACLKNLKKCWLISWFWAAIEFACFRWVRAILILWQSGMCESQSTCQTLLFSHCLESLQIQFCF